MYTNSVGVLYEPFVEKVDTYDVKAAKSVRFIRTPILGFFSNGIMVVDIGRNVLGFEKIEENAIKLREQFGNDSQEIFDVETGNSIYNRVEERILCYTMPNINTENYRGGDKIYVLVDGKLRYITFNREAPVPIITYKNLSRLFQAVPFIARSYIGTRFSYLLLEKMYMPNKGLTTEPENYTMKECYSGIRKNELSEFIFMPSNKDENNIKEIIYYSIHELDKVPSGKIVPVLEMGDIKKIIRNTTCVRVMYDSTERVIIFYMLNALYPGDITFINKKIEKLLLKKGIKMRWLIEEDKNVNS